MIGPPTNSAAMNCHPIRTNRTRPSSRTRLVEANMNTMAVMKSAPFAKSDFDIAEAAYEHEDETIPKPAALPTALGERVPRAACIRSFETKAWTMPDSVNPRINAQRVSHSMKKASRSERHRSSRTPERASRCMDR